MQAIQILSLYPLPYTDLTFGTEKQQQFLLKQQLKLKNLCDSSQYFWQYASWTFVLLDLSSSDFFHMNTIFFSLSTFFFAASFLPPIWTSYSQLVKELLILLYSSSFFLLASNCSFCPSPSIKPQNFTTATYFTESIGFRHRLGRFTFPLNTHTNMKSKVAFYKNCSLYKTAREKWIRILGCLGHREK